MGAHTLLGGFLDVQDDRLSLGCDAEGRGEAFAALAATPLLLRVEVADVADADKLHEIHLTGLVRAAHRGVRFFQVLLRGERRHAARDSLRLHGAQAIRESLLGHGVHGDHVDHVRALAIRVWVDEQTQRRVRLHRGPLAGAAHDGDALDAREGTEGGRGRELSPVAHQQQVRVRGDFIAVLEGAAHRDVRADHFRELRGVGRDHACRAHCVAHDGGAGLGHPLDPFPLAQAIRRAQDGDLEFRRVDEARQVHHDRAHLVVDGLALARELNVAEVAEEKELAHVIRVVVHVDETLHRREADDVHLRHRVDRGALKDQTEGLRAGPVAESEEVVGAALARPQARAVGRQRHQRVGVGVHPVVVGALLLRDLAHRVAGLRQVGQVLAALRHHARAVLGELAIHVEADHAQHSHQHSAAHQHRAVVVAAVLYGHEDHDARGTQHGHDHHEDVTHRCGLGLLRRHLDSEAAGGLLRNRGTPPFSACNHEVSSRCARMCSIRLHPV